MIIIAGYMEIEPKVRDEYVRAHIDLTVRARRAQGCLDLAISADPVRANRVNLFERWATEEALNAWRPVSDAPQLDVEFLGGDVSKYIIGRVAPAFD